MNRAQRMAAARSYEEKELRAKISELKRRIRLARAIVSPLINWAIYEKGEHKDPLLKVLPVLNLQKPLPPRGRK